MSVRPSVVCPLLIAVFLGVQLGVSAPPLKPGEDVVLKTWPAPLYWQPSQSESEATLAGTRAEIRPATPDAATPAGSLVFVAMTPCRVVDTRASQMFAAPFGAPSLLANATRSFPIQSSGMCSIPASAQAYSFNVTVIPPAGLGYLTIWPTGQSQPNAVTLDDITGDIRNNAAIVPAGTPNGSVDVHVNAATDLVIDINGYYARATGITLAQGAAGAPSLSFSGDPATGIFSSGAGVLNLVTGGASALTVRSDQDLDLAGNIRKGGTLFLHSLGTMSVGVGLSALAVNTGSNNTANGYSSMLSNTNGHDNTASGANALGNNTTGSDNTATGGALTFNTTGNNNTASGFAALTRNTTGSNNTASGSSALGDNLTGSNNTALGSEAGSTILGSNNIDIGNMGTSVDSGTIRVGTSGTQTRFFVAGVRTVTTGNMDAVPVMIDSAGQLGTVNSSRRFKEDIQDMNDASSGLLRLRPVTYRYQRPYADGSKPLDYGLIAEEVAKVYPELVVKSADGQIETVQYHKLVPMLLNELQRLQARVAVLEKRSEVKPDR